jgi:hypothetical protein
MNTLQNGIFGVIQFDYLLKHFKSLLALFLFLEHHSSEIKGFRVLGVHRKDHSEVLFSLRELVILELTDSPFEVKDFFHCLDVFVLLLVLDYEGVVPDCLFELFVESETVSEAYKATDLIRINLNRHFKVLNCLLVFFKF